MMIIFRNYFRSLIARLMAAALFLTGVLFLPEEIQSNEMFDPAKIDMSDPVPACETAITENSLFADALEVLRPWVTNPATRSSSLSRGIELCRTAMESLNEISEIDSFLEKTAEAHPDDWRVLKTVAEQYASITSSGSIRDGSFIRENAGYGFSSAERDRVRALQLYLQGMPLLEKDRETGNADSGLVFEFYRGFAEVCLVSGEPWRMQVLTDLNVLPDYTPDVHSWHDQTFAPVDSDGNPIFYQLPEKFEDAANDGERWRYLLSKAAGSGAENGLDAIFQYANFLVNEFGPATFGGVPFQFEENLNGDEEKETSLSAIGALASLDDDETIARLACGIKRFRLPDDQNPIFIFRRIMDGDLPQNEIPADPETLLIYQRRAAMELAEIYMNRRQFIKAEEVYRKLSELEAAGSIPEEGRVGKRELERITGSFGAFEPTHTEAAGTNTSFIWRYRNGKKAKFRAQEIDVRRLIGDVKDYLRSLSQNPPDEWDVDKVRLEDIGWKLMNNPETARKYLSYDIAEWSVDLSPAPDHNDARISIPFPVEKPGAYLLRGMMENGNSDAIILWLSDTAIVSKQVQGKTLWYVADAKTGAPVPEASLHFFGYMPERMSKSEAGALGLKDNGKGRWRVSVKEFDEKVNHDGYYFFKAEKGNARNRWLVTADTMTEDGNGRFAFYGFDTVWYDRSRAEVFAQERACFMSDRSLYRPNDAVHFRFWGGSAGYYIPETWSWGQKTARLVISAPDGRDIVNKEVQLDETGGYEDVLETDDSFTLGEYRFRLDITAERNGKESDSESRKWISVGYGHIILEEYRKPEFEVHIDAPEKPVKLGDTFRVKIRADYYFGSPVTNASVRWSVIRTAENKTWYPPQRWDWLYGNGYSWLAPNAYWFPGWAKWGVPAPLPPWHDRFYNPPETVASGEGEIGEDGSIEIPIDTSIAALLLSEESHQYEIRAEVTDASRRTVAGTSKVSAVREPYQVYTWTNKGFYGPGESAEVSIQARRVDGIPVSGTAKVRVSKITYTADPNHPQKKIPNETEILSDEVAVDAAGTGSLSFALNDAGQYHFEAEVADGEGNSIKGGSLISVIGSGARSADTAFSNPLEIIIEKPEYQPGEKARIRINSAFPNSSVLLFVRSEGSNAGEPVLLHLKDGTEEYELLIIEADRPNLWLEAVTVYNGHFYHETKNIPIPPIHRILNVQVTPDKDSYKPGENAQMNIKVTDPNGNPVEGEITAAIYDRSLDGLTDADNTDLKKLFWDWTRHCYPIEKHTLDKLFQPIPFPQKVEMPPLGIFSGFAAPAGEPILREEEADTVSTLSESGRGVVALSDSVNGMMTGGAKQFGAPLGMMKNSLTAPAAMAPAETDLGAVSADPAAIRSEFADTALWVGRLKTDQNGTASLTFKMPENLTSWKTRVWSFAPGTRVGEGEAETVTRKDLILRMQRPRFLTQSDTVILSANIHNFADHERIVTAELKTGPGQENAGGEPIRLRSGSEAVKKLRIPAGGETRVDWEVDALSAGTGSLVMTAAADDESDGVAEEIPVHLHGIMKQTAFSKTIPQGEDSEPKTVRFTITVPEERIPEKSELTIRYTPTLAGAMLDAIPYLAEYPYGCTEQTLNRFLPAVLTRRLLLDSGLDLESLKYERANLNAQELGDPETRRRQWNQKRDIFGESVSENETSSSDPVFDAGEMASMIDAGISRLSEMQCSDGGWGWFSGWNERSDPHLTALIVDGLYLAQDSYLEVPEEMLTGGTDWLTAYLEREYRKLRNGEQWNSEAKQEAPLDWKSEVSAEDVLVFCVLSNWKKSGEQNAKETDPEKYADMMMSMKDFIWRDRTKLSPYTLSLYGMALTEIPNLSDTDAERLEMTVQMLRQYLKSDDQNQTAWLDLNGSGWYYWQNDEIETDAAFLRLLIRTDSEEAETTAPKLVKYLLNNRKHAGYWKSTRDTAYVLTAFWEFLTKTGELINGSKVEIRIDGELKKTETITPENIFTIDNSLVLAGSEISAGEHVIEISSSGIGPLYCNVYQADFTTEPFIRKAGLETEITRTYWRLTEDETADLLPGKTGLPVSQRVRKMKRERLEDGAAIKSGELIEVELNITSRNNYESILIEDRKPAGFEPTDPSSGYNGNELGAYVEFRDSRVSFFVHRLRQGVSTLTYRLRAETPGTVSALPATTEGIYAPELRGNSDEFQTTVTE